MAPSITGPPLAVETCRRRLGGYGDLGTGAPQACAISWYPGGEGEDESEESIQAACGLMHIHGLDGGRPRRLGLEVASVAAGMLAAQGVLAAALAGTQGSPVEVVETSVAQAALTLVTQYVARATAAVDWGGWLPQEPGPEPGPPFPTADGPWVEVETLSASGWQRFWTILGVDEAAVRRGWNLFRPRYATAVASMPAGFHAATAARPAAELCRLGQSCGVAVVALRPYREVVADVALRRLAFPTVRPATDPGTGPAIGAAPRPPAPRPPARADRELPLEGTVVVEATSRIQGPLAGSLLRMLGARVMRVEPPGGDGARMEAPLAGDTGAFFCSMNRGKHPVELDLASGAGRRRLQELLAGADVFLHNWRAGKAEEWGLGPAQLAAVNPRLVSCHASGWGALARRCPPIAMEFLVQAFTGLGHGLNPEDRPPFPTRMLVTDAFGALLASEGVVAALLSRERLGVGSYVETSLAGGAMAMQAHVVERLAGGRAVAGRRNGRPRWDAGGGEAPARCRTPAELPADPRLAPLLEPLGGTSWAPGRPWRFGTLAARAPGGHGRHLLA